MSLNKIFRKTLYLDKTQFGLYENFKRLFGIKRERIKDHIKNMNSENPAAEDEINDEDTINVGETGDTGRKKSQTVYKPFGNCHRYLYTPNESLFKIRENFFEEQTYINFALHLCVDYIKRDQRVKGYYVPLKKLDFNNVVCVVTNENNRQIVENNNCIFADENIIKQIKSQEVSYSKIIFTTDSLNLIDQSLKSNLHKNNLFPDKDLLTLCEQEELNKVLDKFNNGLIEFRMNDKNIIECPIGMTGFTNKEILMNLDNLIKAIIKSKPKSFRGMRYFKKGFLGCLMEEQKYFELSIPSITPTSYSYFMNQKILDEDNVVKITNITEDLASKSDDEFNLKI